nr:hypothetical protein [uncultured Albidiferax sp.]
MHSILDSRHELELVGLKYDGRNLSAEVIELIVVDGGHVAHGACRYLVNFPKPIAHALTEEFPAMVAELIRGKDTGFLRRIESDSLRSALGLNLEQFSEQFAYALITAHEILVVYCAEEPLVVEQSS